MGKMLVARESGVVLLDGTEFTIARGQTRIDSDHPLAKRTPAEWWEDADVTYPVEQATAAPAEKRTTAAKKKAEEEASE